MTRKGTGSALALARALCGALLVLAFATGCPSMTSDQKRVSDALAVQYYAAGEWGFAYLAPGVWAVDCPAKPDGKTPIDGCRKATADEMEHACDVPETREDCRAYSKAVNRLRKDAQLADHTQTLGRLPKSARSNLKALTKCAERKGQCPEILRPASGKQ